MGKNRKERVMRIKEGVPLILGWGCPFKNHPLRRYGEENLICCPKCGKSRRRQVTITNGVDPREEENKR